MTALQIIALIAFIIALAGVLGYFFQSGKDEEEVTFTTPEYTKEELDNIKLAEELYNKDLRPVVIKKVADTTRVFPDDAAINMEVITETEETKPEFPIDKPKKKRKYYPKKKK
jgi:hypothetical protein